MDNNVLNPLCLSMCVYEYVRLMVYLCMCVYMNMFVYLLKCNIYICVFVSACVYVFVYVCVCVYPVLVIDHLLKGSQPQTETM